MSNRRKMGPGGISGDHIINEQVSLLSLQAECQSLQCKESQQAYLRPLGARGVVGSDDSPRCHAAGWGWARQAWGAVILGSLVSNPC